MRTRKFIALSLISAGAAILVTGCPSQPPGPCVVARTGGGPLTGNGAGFPYVAQYYLTPGSETGDCTTNPAIAAWPAGNFVGQIWAEAYGAVTASLKLTGLVPEEFGWTNQYTGDYVECGQFDPGCTHNPISLGNFTADVEDENGNCTIKGSDAGQQEVNGVLVTYDYTNVLVYATAAAGEGTQMQATVTITRDDGVGAACVRSYTAIGLWPTAVCNVDNDCNPNPQPNNSPPRPLGSGTLPGIPLQCVNAAANDPILVPGDFLGPDGFGCTDGSTDEPYVIQTVGCGGGAKDNNGTGGTSICFFVGPGPTTFPYLQTSTN
jgi:hypothetical protein